MHPPWCGKCAFEGRYTTLQLGVPAGSHGGGPGQSTDMDLARPGIMRARRNKCRLAWLHTRCGAPCTRRGAASAHSPRREPLWCHPARSEFAALPSARSQRVRGTAVSPLGVSSRHCRQLTQREFTAMPSARPEQVHGTAVSPPGLSSRHCRQLAQSEFTALVSACSE